MSDNGMKILITASLNEGLSVKEINKKIKQIEGHASLKAIRLKVDVDQSILKTLKEFNKSISSINQSMGLQGQLNKNVASTGKQSADAVNRETQALNKQNQALEKNNKLKTKIITSDNGYGGQDVRTDVTTGDSFRSKTTSETVKYNEEGKPEYIKNPTVENFNHAKLKEAEESLKRFTENSNKRLTELRKTLGNLNPEIVNLSKEIKGLGVNSSKGNLNSIDDQIKSLETFAKQEKKAREEVNNALKNIGKQARQEEIDDINKRAELSQKVRLAEFEKQMAMNRIRIQDESQAWYEAYKEKEKREEFLHGKRIQDTYRAYDLAKKEDTVFNQNRIANEEKFSLKQQESLNKIAIARQKFGHHKQVAPQLDEIEQQVKGLNSKSIDWEKTIKRSNTEITKATAGFRAMRQESIGLVDSFKTALIKFPIWVASATAIYAPIRGLQSAIDLIYQVDSQMTQLKRVMDDSTNFEGMLKRSIELTKELGQSITTINESMIEFARMGYDEQQVTALAKTATLAQNISELSAKEAVDAIVAGMIVWNIEADKSITIIDRLNEIDNNFSVTTQNLAISMQKASATAKNFGVELNTLLGHSTSIMAATRESGAVIGNSLRTIYSRITTMKDVEDSLQAIGISIRDLATKDMRPVQDILTDLQAKWHTLNNEQRQNIAFTMAGRYQLNRFTSLMENWEMGLEATEAAMNSNNSSIRENAKYLQSLEARTNRMKAAWQEMSLTMGDAVINDALIGLIGLGTSLGNTLNFMIDKVGLLPILFGAVGMAIYAFNTGIRVLTLNIVNAVRAMSGLPPATMAASLSMRGIASASAMASAALNGLKFALRGLLMSTGIGAALALVGWGLELLVGSGSKAKDTTDELISSMETMNAKISDLQRLQHLSGEYEKLATSAQLTTNEKIRLSNITQELNDKFALSITAINGENEVVKLNNELIEQKISLLKDEISLEREKLSNEFRGKETENRNKIEEEQKKLKETEEAYKKAKDAQEKFIKTRNSGEIISNLGEKYIGKESFPFTQNFDPKNSEHANYIKLLGEQLAKATEEARIEFETANVDFSQTVNNVSLALKGEFRNYLDGIEASGKEIQPSTRIFFDELAKLDAQYDLKINTNDLQEFFNIINVTSIADVEMFNNLLSKRFPDSSNNFGSALKSMRDELIKLNQAVIESNEEVTDGFENIVDKTESLKKAFDDAANPIKDINQVINDMNNSQSISSEKIAELIIKYPQLVGKIEKTTDGYKINKEALSELRKVEIERAKEKLTSEVEMSKIAIKETENRIKTYKAEIQAIQSLINAESARNNKNKESSPLANIMNSSSSTTELFSGKFNDKLNSAYNEYLYGSTIDKYQDEIAKEEKALEDQKDSLQKEIDLIESLMNQLNDIDFGVSNSKSKSTKSAKEDKAKIQDLTDARINAINALAEAEGRLNEQLRKEIEVSSGSGNYNDALQKTNKLFDGQRKEINLLADANKKLLQERNKTQAANKNYDMSKWVDENGNATVSFVSLFNSMKTGTAQDNLQALFDKYLKFTSAIKDNNSAITELYDNIKNTIDQTLQHIQNASNSIVSKSNRKISLLGNINTQEEKDKLVEYSQEISNELRKESGRIFAEISKLKKIIADPSGDKILKDAARQSLKTYEDAANEVHQDLIAQAESLGQMQAEAIIFGFNKKIEDLEYEKSLLSNSDEDVKKAEAIDAEIKKVRLNAQKAFHAEILKLEKRLTESISTEERMRAQTMLEILQDTSKEYTSSLVNILKKELDEREKYVDKVISDYKKMLEKQRDLELDAIAEREKAEDERHKNAMDNYKKELDDLKKIIDAQLQAMDRQNASDDYDRELNKLLDEEAKIQNKINTISFNDTFEDKAKRKDLEEKLAAIRDEIEAKQRERGRVTQREALEDLLKDREDHISNLEDLENKDHDNIKKGLENEKNARKRHWDSVLADEKKFYDLKNNLMSNDFTIVQNTLNELKLEYGGFFNFLESQASMLKEMFATLHSNTKLDYDYLDKFPTENAAKASDWNEYLSNKKKAEEIRSPSNPEFQKLRARNDELRSKWGFMDGSYDQLKNMQIYHKGGEVGSENTSTKKWWNKILKSNEVPAILKKKEVVLDNPINFVNDLVSRTLSGISNISPRSALATNSDSMGDTIIENIHITLQESIKDGTDLASKLVQGMNMKGIRVGRNR